MEMGKEKRAPPSSMASQVNPLVVVLGFVCMGLLVAVVTMSALMNADNDGGGGYTTLVCPGGTPATPVKEADSANSETIPDDMSPPPSVVAMTTTSPPPSASTPAPPMDCPVETLYWEFPAGVYGGCVWPMRIMLCFS